MQATHHIIGQSDGACFSVPFAPGPASGRSTGQTTETSQCASAWTARRSRQTTARRAPPLPLTLCSRGPSSRHAPSVQPQWCLAITVQWDVTFSSGDQLLSLCFLVMFLSFLQVFFVLFFEYLLVALCRGIVSFASALLFPYFVGYGDGIVALQKNDACACIADDACDKRSLYLSPSLNKHRNRCTRRLERLCSMTHSLGTTPPSLPTGRLEVGRHTGGASLSASLQAPLVSGSSVLFLLSHLPFGNTCLLIARKG